MPDELKPCKCGAMPRHVVFEGQGARIAVHQVMCYSCHTKPKIFGRGFTKQRAIDAWNRRVGCEPAGEYAKGNRAQRGTWPGEEGEKG